MAHIISQTEPPEGLPATDVAIVGGGAAGLAAAIFTARLSAERANTPRIVVLDGARTLGAKILVSGGARCNVTNTRVEAADFWRSGSPFVKQVLRGFTVGETIAFFEELGVALKEEPLGKLFPTTNKSRTVLDALLREADRLGIAIRASCRVKSIARETSLDTGWILETSLGTLRTRCVVLATGGLSLPKTGSDGAGYEFARSLGHTLVPTVPALEPLILNGDFHPPLSGIAHDAAIRISRHDEKPIDIRGSLLWTHFGISGPLPLNASRFMRRAKAEGTTADLTVSFLPGLSREAVDQHLISGTRDRPHHNIANDLARSFGLVQALATRIVTTAIGSDDSFTGLTRAKRLAVVKALTEFRLDVVDGRGYNFAEVTSGGVRLDEVNPKTMESRLAPGLYFVGEILDVDGRIGGFNFQWAWSTARVASRALANAIPAHLP